MPWRALLASTLAAVVGLLWHFNKEGFDPHFFSLSPTGKIEEDFDVYYHLGGYSPWIQKKDGTLQGDIRLPEECVVDQVHMMSRHAERYPTMLPGIRMLELYQRRQHSNVTFTGDLAFVDSWNFFAPHPNEQFEQLTSTSRNAGTLQAYSTGVKLRTRYQGLLEDALARNQTTFWASQSDRVIESARLFATGFFGLDWEAVATLEVIPETQDRGADTLTPGRSCPKYATDEQGHSSGVEHLNRFRSTYLRQISTRLQKQNPGISFSDGEIYSLQEMCGFETLAKGSSKWCNVFTREEQLQFEYARDVLYYYRSGPGNKYGPTLGWLWLNATADLLRRGPEAGPMFLSFDHDGDMIALMAAMDIFPQQPHLPTSHVSHNRTWKMSDVTPMGGRFILERFSCSAPQRCWDNAEFGYPNHLYCDPPENNTYVRLNINDGIVPIPECTDGPVGGCSLGKFIERVKKREEQIDNFPELCGLTEEAPKRITFLHQ